MTAEQRRRTVAALQEPRKAELLRAHHPGARLTTPRIYYSPKPIPDRSFDWEAWEREPDLGVRVGHGATEAAAIADLEQQLEDDRGA